MTNWMRLRHHHRQPITQPSHHHRHGLDTLPALHPGGEPGTREAQAEPEPAPSSTQAVNAQQRPAETKGEPTPSRGGEDARPAGERQHPASPGKRERLHPCRASTQPSTRASPTAYTQEADDLERERREKRGSAQKITA